MTCPFGSECNSNVPAPVSCTDCADGPRSQDIASYTDRAGCHLIGDQWHVRLRLFNGMYYDADFNSRSEAEKCFRQTIRMMRAKGKWELKYPDGTIEETRVETVSLF